MPSPEAILSTLTGTAYRWWPLAVAFHVVLGVVLFTLLRGWRPSRRTAGRLLVAPLLSVSALAWSVGNPFNAVVFAVFAGWLGWRTTRLAMAPVSIGTPPMLAVAVPTLVFAWTYPHFLGPPSWIYLVAAPLGLIPCPTLAALIGLLLVLNALESKTWAVGAATIGLAYGLIGAFRLGVLLDAGLVLGAIGLLTVASTTLTSRRMNVRAQRKVAA